MHYLKSVWNKEVDLMVAESLKEKTKRGKDMARILSSIDD